MPRLLGIGAVWLEQSKGRGYAAGALVEALCAVRRAGWDVDVLTVRGGDAAGAVLARSLAARGLGDLSGVFLDRATPVSGERGEDGLALYGLMLPKLLRRRAFRDAAAAADAVLVDTSLPGIALQRVLAAARGPVLAVESAAGAADHLVPLLPRLRAAALGQGALRSALGLPPRATIGSIAGALARAKAAGVVVAAGEPVSFRFEGGCATLSGNMRRPARGGPASAIVSEIVALR